MIFDCHTHLFYPGQVGGATQIASQRAWGEDYNLIATAEQHKANIDKFDGAIVLAMDAPATGIVVPNLDVAQYVQTNPTRLFGFASVDPNKENAPDLLESDVRTLQLCGLKLGPIYQNFYPDDRRHFELYAKANELKIPIMWHQGTSFVPEGFLDASRPAMLDPIARAFPELKMVIAHMGHPWIEECIAVVRKNTNMYMDLSALGGRPWQFYNALALAMEYDVTHKILLGSDFPFFTTAKTIELLKKVNDIVNGTNLPKISDRIIHDIIYRNTPELLGLV